MYTPPLSVLMTHTRKSVSFSIIVTYSTNFDNTSDLLLMKYAVTYGVIISKCKDILVSTNRINIHWATEVTVYKLEGLMNFLYTFLVKRDSVHFPCAQASHSLFTHLNSSCLQQACLLSSDQYRSN